MAERNPPLPPRPVLIAAREYVGPDDAREDVTDVTDRALVLRAVHEVLCTRHDIGKLLAELGSVATRLTVIEKKQRASGQWQEQAEDEITLVKDLRKTVKHWRSRAIGAAIAVIVAVVTAYVCMKLGIKV